MGGIAGALPIPHPDACLPLSVNLNSWPDLKGRTVVEILRLAKGAPSG